jgi:hypothetical protein
MLVCAVGRGQSLLDTEKLDQNQEVVYGEA